MAKKAIFTIVRNEPIFTEIWLKYYEQFFAAQDIHIINHVDDSPFDDYVDTLKDRANIEYLVYRETFDHEWLRNVVQTKQRKLLRQYSTVVFAECDEIIHHPKGLANYIDELKTDVATATGIEIVHILDEEDPIDLRKPLLRQRTKCYYSHIYSKTLISKIPLSWVWGFHFAEEQITPDPKLSLIHLHKMDWDICSQRNAMHRHTLLEAKSEGCPGQQNWEKDKWLRENFWYNSVDHFPKEVKSELVDISDEIRDSI